MIDLKKYIKDHHNFPLAGIIFKDIIPILYDPKIFNYVIDKLAEKCKDADVIVGAEARGFIFGSPVAYKLQKPFVMARKQGKIPGKTISKKYNLEYTNGAIIEMQVGNIKPGQKVIIVDDLLATGWTARAISELVRELGGIVIKNVYVIELSLYNWKQNNDNIPVESLIKY